jgi:succinate dehydrogenase (ubiquinone) flavoprotein subunit
MQKTMQSDVAIFRTHDSLAEGYERIQAVERDFVNRLAVKDHSLI